MTEEELEACIDLYGDDINLSWTHYQVIMTIEDPVERSFISLKPLRVSGMIKH